MGGQAAVAVREGAGAAYGWGSIRTNGAAPSDYVVFWGNLFDWLAGGGVRFESHPPGHMEGTGTALELAGGETGPGGKLASEPGLWPGLYQRVEDGALRAVNAGPVAFPALPSEDWRPKLAAALSGLERGGAPPFFRRATRGGRVRRGGGSAVEGPRSLTAFSGRRTVPVDT